MEALVIVLVACVVLLALAMLCVLVWRDKIHIRQIDELTSKIVAKTLGEYTYSKQTEKIPSVQKEPFKGPIDPVLGRKC